MAQTNRAYDLELFQPREARLVALKNNKKVQEDTRRRTRRQSVLNVVVYLVLGLLVMGAVGFFITGRVVLTEMKQELADQMDIKVKVKGLRGANLEFGQDRVLVRSRFLLFFLLFLVLSLTAVFSAAHF